MQRNPMHSQCHVADPHVADPMLQIIPAIVMHACDCFVSETDHMSLFSIGLACRRSCLHAHCYPFTVLQEPITRNTPPLLLQLQ